MWWEEQLGDIAPQVVAALRGHRSHAIDVDAVAGDVALDLVRILQGDRRGLPGGWFGDGPPRDAERRAFWTLVLTLTRRRYYDQLRRRYVRARELPGREPADAGVERLLDARTLLLHLARLVDQLPEDERDLITGVVAPGPDRRLGARDRQRLARLRQRLARELAISIRSGRRG